MLGRAGQWLGRGAALRGPHLRVQVGLGRSVASMLALALLLLAACGTRSALVRAPTGVASPSPRAASATPTPDTHPAVGTGLATARADAIADAYLANMSLDEKLGQLFLIESTWTDFSYDVDIMVNQLHAGAMIIYQQNEIDPQQVHDMIATIQAHTTIPMLISTDEEGGVVDRLLPFDGPHPAAQDLAASGDPQQAYQAAATEASQLQQLGINTDLAPVADVRTIPNAIEYTRLFGDDPATVDRYAGAFLQGLQQNGEIGCLKHWPGIGGTSSDPHLTLPVLTRSRSELESVDFAAFRNLLAMQPGMIMVTHVIVQAIDATLPASLSPALVQGVLRGELGYDGVVMTDSLYMKGISDQYSLGEAAVLAIIAGDDLLEGAYSSYSMSIMLDALRAAISQGRISTARIDQSVRRILRLKARFGLLPAPAPSPSGGAALTAPGLTAATADLPRGAQA